MKSRELFDNDLKGKALEKKTIDGGVTTVFFQFSILALHFLSLAILSRILTVEDFGLVAMATAFTNLAYLFSNFGLANATIQRESISKDEISSLFWLNALIGFCLALILFFVAFPLSKFYEEENLQGIVQVSSLCFLFSALTMQHDALLKRNLRLFELNIVGLFATILSILIAVFMALKGFSYWSIVAMAVFKKFFNMLGVWLVCFWVPRATFQFKKVKTFFIFGLNITGFNFVNYFSRNLDKILIGKFFGDFSLGLFSRVDQIALFPLHRINAPVSTSILPALSKLQFKEKEYINYYSNGLKMVSTLGTPIIFYLFVMADECILFILGENWIEASSILMCILPAAFCGVTNIATGWVYNSIGHVDRQFKWGIYSSIFYCISIIIGVYFGIIGVAIAVSISRLIEKVPGLLYCYDGTFMKLRHFFNPIIPSLLISTNTSLFLLYFKNTFLLEFSAFFLIVITLPIFLFFYLLMLWLFQKNFCKALINYIKKS